MGYPITPWDAPILPCYSVDNDIDNIYNICINVNKR